MLRRRELPGLTAGVNSLESHARSAGSVMGLILILQFLFLMPSARGADKKPLQEEARFDIYLAGKEIGQEKYSIQSSSDSIRSNSVLKFRDPGNQHQSVQIETQLNMDNRYLPKAYQLQTDIGGRKTAIAGTFTPGEASFQYQADGQPVKSGLLVGDRYTILDTDVFHHFVFIARLFDFALADKSQSLEVIVPQEMANGLLKVRDVGIEEISVRGKKRELHHLSADSGRFLIDLWVDGDGVLYKIALPARQIEAIRNP